MTMALSAAMAAKAEDYRLGVDDKVAVDVYEFPQIEGVYAVSASGAIMVPPLGIIEAVGKTPDELATEIGARIGARGGSVSASMVSVVVDEYRPIYVLGDVAQPGAYPFRPGMTVVEALSVAGGAYRLQDPTAARLQRDAIIEAGTIAIQERERVTMVYRIARLETELGGAEAVTYPADIATSESPQLLELLARREDAVFETRRELQKEQTRALEGLQEMYGSEIETMTEQIELKESQVAAFDAQLQGMRRSAVPTPEQLELERARADAQSDRLDLSLEIQRVNRAIAEADQEIVTLLDGRSSEIAEELAEAEIELARIENQIQTSQGLLLEAQELAPMELQAMTDLGQTPLIYRVLRRDGGAPAEIEVSELDALAAGDVLKVSRELIEVGTVETGG
jgi:protein involved in polysaccharide export with SLBB domain